MLSEGFLKVFAGSVAGKLIATPLWDYIKKVYFKVVRKKDEGNSTERNEVAIITDQFDGAGRHVTLIFVFNDSLNDDDLNLALNTLWDARSVILEANENNFVNFNLTENQVIKATFKFGRWDCKSVCCAEHEIVKKSSLMTRFLGKK